MNIVKERLMQYVDFKGINKVDFFKNIGLVKSNFSGSGADSDVTSSKLFNILNNYPDINSEWLLTGKGEMLKGNNGYEIDKTFHQSKTAEPFADSNTIPLYDLPATAGVSQVFAENPQSIPIDHITIPNLPKCDGALHVRGDSMYPLLKSGDIVAYKVIHNIYNIIWGEMYLIYVSHEGDDYFFCKFLKKSSKEGYAEFISHNQHHQTVEFPLESIKALAMVKASIRFNTLF
ncbi:helix-turn-helix transcriptional regulator [Chryseobacterium sp. KCF3-3]|uniref:S24 family peptidase n=1 Tax=Chryseobacterium sp. KCF3-3 TaxID=3231511 RepID=UPI0038B36978